MTLDLPNRAATRVGVHVGFLRVPGSEERSLGKLDGRGVVSEDETELFPFLI